MSSTNVKEPIEEINTNSTQGLTILRLKRKRNEEPLDALVVEQLLRNGVEHGKKKPKKRGSIDKQQFSPLTTTTEQEESLVPFMFRFAETVEKVSFNDSIKTRQLQNRRKERYKVIDGNRQKGIESVFTIISDNESDIMCNFIPLVKQYLTIQEDDKKSEDKSDDEDYVYDVYYQDDSTMLDDEIQYQNFATLTWFGGEENQVFVKETKNQELYEYSDEEDSNAEDYYTHDYPEEDNEDESNDDYSSDEQDYYY
ncbi:14465_t:CDS:2 [Entrophospora sp. SA101]|nr:7901_t:CDS:2 [Entrophospora sp. SA101]CAJ0899861.1 14465_t:CDS:2 [Entrophospora sp. SA101]